MAAGQRPKGKRLNNGPDRGYNSRIQKGGALIEDMRLLVRHWQNGSVKGPMEAMVGENLLGKPTRARALDTFRCAFLPRFVNGDPPEAWKIVRALEDRNLPLEILRPVYYWITARSERLLYDFVGTDLLPRAKGPIQPISTEDVSAWVKSRLAAGGKAWSEAVTTRVAQGILATLRDFGILEGTAKKRMAPGYISFESFAYLAFAFHQEGATGSSLLNHRDWSLFLFSPPVVERLFLEADRNGLLRFQAAGKIVRIDFPAHSFEEMADVVAARAH